MKKIQKMLAFTAVFAVLSAEVAINPVPVFSAEKELSDTQETSSVLAGDDSYIDLSPIFPNGNAGTKENPYCRGRLPRRAFEVKVYEAEQRTYPLCA